MNTLSGQSLLQHIVDGDLDAVTVFLRNEVVNLDERDQVTILKKNKIRCANISYP